MKIRKRKEEEIEKKGRKNGAGKKINLKTVELEEWDREEENREERKRGVKK